MRHMNTKKGQALIEYVGLIIMLCFALFALTMRGYLQRAIQGRMKENIDTVSDIQYSSDSSYNLTQTYTGMNVRTQDGKNYNKVYDLGHTIWRK